APPAEGRANAALEALLAKLCGVKRRAVHIERGETARDKTVRVERPGTLPLVDS
ncbi:MAG: YggU family protein, partial [Gammaproteobacteria bacterium]|nr:YggU family protein [Gammaproteobacteria bacterium]